MGGKYMSVDRWSVSGLIEKVEALSFVPAKESY
jgi:hypothetical protein